MKSAAMTILIALALLATSTGCRQPRAAEPTGWFGPTEPMQTVVAAININTAAIPTLRAVGNFEARVVEGKKRHFVNGEITILHRQPAEIRLIGTKDLAGRIFEAGSNGERYWLIVKADTDTMWWGALSSLDRISTQELPIRPDLLIEVLGIDPIDTNFLQPPLPTMRFNNDADAYMFTFNVRAPDRWVVQKEVWYDRQTRLPRMVLLFDEHGRVVLRAYLSNPEPVEGASRGAKVATRYQVFFPETGTTMRFDLEEVALTRRNAPNDRSFVFPAEPGVSRVINLDEESRP